MTQKERIYQYMVTFGSITPMEAFSDLGITKLSTRIGEMIADGKRIQKTTERGANRYGEIVWWTRYRLDS